MCLCVMLFLPPPQCTWGVRKRQISSPGRSLVLPALQPGRSQGRGLVQPFSWEMMLFWPEWALGYSFQRRICPFFPQKVTFEHLEAPVHDIFIAREADHPGISRVICIQRHNLLPTHFTKPVWTMYLMGTWSGREAQMPCCYEVSPHTAGLPLPYNLMLHLIVTRPLLTALSGSAPPC